MSVLSRVIFDPDTTAPSIPGGVSVSALSQTALRVTWSASTDTGGSGLAGYKVYVSTTLAGTYSLQQTLSTSSLSYDLTGLTASTTRYFKVTAYDGNGNENTLASVTAVVGTTQPAVGGSTLFQDDFESGSMAASQNGWSWQQQEVTSTNSISLVSGVSFDGTRSLRFRFGGQFNTNCEQNLSFPSINDVYCFQRILIPLNFFHPGPGSGHAANNKFLLAIWGNSDPDYSDTRTPGFDINLYPSPNPNAGSAADEGYVFYFSIPNQFDNSNTFPFVTAADIGQWVEFVIRGRTAANSSTAGRVEVWKKRATQSTWAKVSDSFSTSTSAGVVNYRTGQTGWTNAYIFGYCNSGFNAVTDFHLDKIQFSATDLWGLP